MPIVTLAPASAIAKLHKWNQLATHINQWHYEPDLMALRALMAASAAHFEPETEALCMFLLGPSGSGKTAIAINSILGLPNAYLMGEITPKTFLSGYTGKGTPSLLHQLGSAILVWKDFTTVLSLRQEARMEIASQIREIIDGYFTKDTGVGERKPWTGKMTIVGAATDALEKYWAMTKTMGNRFIYIRWPRLDGRKVAQAARRQQGHEKEISTVMRRLATDFFISPRISNPPPDVTDQQAARLAALAELVSFLHAHVERAMDGSREIRDLPQIDQTGRLGKTLVALPRFHSSLFGKESVDEDDMAIASRVAMDTIPLARGRIIRSIPPDGSLDLVNLAKLSGMSQSALHWTLDELLALGCLIKHEHGTGDEYEMSPLIRELWMESLPNNNPRSF